MFRLITPLFAAFIGLSVIGLPMSAIAADELRPYVLTDFAATALDDAETTTLAALEASDFTVVGQYSPYPGARVIAFTHPALLKAAAGEKFGGYAAVLRLGLTEVDGKIQRSYANPGYWGTALHVGDLAPVSAALVELFGEGSEFGSKKGLSEKKLTSYRYMMMMPRLRDHDRLGSFDSHEQALATIRGNLANNDNGLTPVFEVAIPGTDEVLFGVGIANGNGADSTVMAATDGEALKHTPHLPYALLVSGSEAYALAGKFRIALAFPDLGMGTFMKISGAPNAIRDSLATLTE